MAYEPFLSAAQFSIGTGGAVSQNDPRVSPLLDAASAAIRRYCGWHIFPVLPESVVLDGPGGSLLVLPTLHVTGITALSNADTVEDVAGLEWSPRGMVRKRWGSWTDKFRGVSVTFEHGYEDVPDLKQIVQQVVANALASPLGATREQAGQTSVSWASTAPGVSGGLSLLERDMAVVNTYKLVRA